MASESDADVSLKETSSPILHPELPQTPIECMENGLVELKGHLAGLKRLVKDVHNSFTVADARRTAGDLAGRVIQAEGAVMRLGKDLEELQAQQLPPIMRTQSGPVDVMRLAQNLASELSDNVLAMSQEEFQDLDEEEEEMNSPELLTESSDPVITVTQRRNLHRGEIANSLQTSEYIFDLVFGAIERIYAAQPNHSMFGAVGKGLIRCPICSRASRTDHNSVSWSRKIWLKAEQIASNTGRDIVPGSCWLLFGNQQEMLWQKKGGGRYASVPVTRLFCFLANPSVEAWGYLTDEKYGVLGKRSLNSPFCHLCHNGSSSKNDKLSLSCVNGFEHGFFGTTTVNNAMKPCGGPLSGKWQCPGHADLGGKTHHCIYVSSQGVISPCRNSLTVKDKSSCKCVPNCFEQP